MDLEYLRKLFAFLSSIWALADIVLDCVTVNKYHKECMDGEISCVYYGLGIVFMLLPVVFASGYIGIILVRERNEFESVFEYLLIMMVFGVFYLVVVPIVSIWFTAKDLFSVGGMEKDMEMIRVLKMFEHIGKTEILYSTWFLIRIIQEKLFLSWS